MQKCQFGIFIFRRLIFSIGIHLGLKQQQELRPSQHQQGHVGQQFHLHPQIAFLPRYPPMPLRCIYNPLMQVLPGNIYLTLDPSPVTDNYSDPASVWLEAQSHPREVILVYILRPILRVWGICGPSRSRELWSPRRRWTGSPCCWYSETARHSPAARWLTWGGRWRTERSSADYSQAKPGWRRISNNIHNNFVILFVS